MTSTPNLYPVRLSSEERARLQALTSQGHAPARTVRTAQVLLLSDRDRPAGALTRDHIAQTLGMHVNTVDRIRKRFALEGEQPVLQRKPRATPPVPPKIDAASRPTWWRFVAARPRRAARTGRCFYWRASSNGAAW